MGNLYIVATPIGNLQDINLRAIETLGSVDFILCEDTRTTSVLLKSFLKINSSFKYKGRLISYYEDNEALRIPETIELLKKDFNFALVSDAGTPTVSDPGFKLVRECIKENIKVISIPGPSAVISALVSSGLPTDKFLFLGFLPKKPSHRQKLLSEVKNNLKNINQTVILYESPHRLCSSLNEIKDIFGDINIVVARELTKIYEEIRREPVSKSIEHFSKIKPKGEFVILFNLK